MAKPFQICSFLLGHHSVRNGLYLPNLANITTHSIIGLLLSHNSHLSQLSDSVTTVFLGHVLPIFHVYDDFSAGAFTVFFISVFLSGLLPIPLYFFLPVHLPKICWSICMQGRRAEAGPGVINRNASPGLKNVQFFKKIKQTFTLM